MARGLGDQGVVMSGANAVAAVREFTISEEGNQVPLIAMGDTFIQKAAALPDVTGTVTCWYDPADSTGQGTLTQGATVNLELRPEGTGSGNPEITVTNAEIVSRVRTVPAEGGMEAVFTWTTTDTALDETAQP